MPLWLSNVRWLDLVEVAILSSLIYGIFVFIKGTRAMQVLKGFVVVVVMAFIAERAHFYAISWILGRLMALLAIALLIVFQPELRRVLAQMGRNPFLGFSLREEEEVVDELVKSANFLSRRKIGAIIAIERDIGLKEYIETGVPIEGKITSELLNTIFTPGTPLHDGAVIVQENTLSAASCILPLPETARHYKHLGTRHQAAIELSRDTDAAVIVISEETGDISLAREGRLSRHLDGITLRKELKTIYSSKRKEFKAFWKKRGKG